MDDFCFVCRDTPDALKHLSTAFSHYDELVRARQELVKYILLIAVGVLQDSMKSRNNRTRDGVKKPEEVSAGRTTKDTELMLYAQDVRVGCIDTPCHIDIIGRPILSNHVADLAWI